MISFGDWRTFFMGFGLVHQGVGILHSDVAVNASEEIIQTVPQHSGNVSFALHFK